MNKHLPTENEFRIVIKQHGFEVKSLAFQLGLEVRTLERHFKKQFRTTPKAWLIRERLRFAPQLLADGCSNKEIAASLNYTCQSNFCRDFKRFFGSAPQEFARGNRLSSDSSSIVQALSHFDKPAVLR